MTNPEPHQASDNPAGLTFADIPPGLAEGPTRLETLLNLLQGGNACPLADPGIAACDPQTLDRIHTAAQLQSDDCLDRMHCLLELLAATLTTNPPALPQITLIGALRHLTRILSDHQRWAVLADNAAYYRDHPQVATKISAYQNATRTQ